MNDRKLKICGLTEIEEAAYVNEARADFAGFVLFFPKSKRNVTIEQAKKIMAALSGSVAPVAVTVSPTMQQVKEIEAAGFSYLQVHGQIPQEGEEEIRIPMIKAFNVNDLTAFEQYAKDPRIAGYVFDAHVPGSGQTFDWDVLKKIPMDRKLRMLAGGIGPDNAAKALAACDVDGIDASSSVENDDGKGKSREKILALAKAVKGSCD